MSTDKKKYIPQQSCWVEGRGEVENYKSLKLPPSDVFIFFREDVDKSFILPKALLEM